MQAICIRFFTEEGARHAHQLIHEWLFDQARDLGIAGGTAFRAAVGFGRHGVKADSFFELAGKLPESVEFAGESAQIEAQIERVGAAGLTLVYVTHPVTIGVTG